MKSVKIELGGKEHYLLFNGAAMFEIDELLSGSTVVDALLPNTRKAFDDLCSVVAVLAEQGELARRLLGHDKSAMLTKDEVRVLVRPADIFELKLAVFNSTSLGYGREIDDKEKQVDLVVAEIEKKTEPA